MRWVSRLPSTETATLDNKKPRNAGLFYEQGDQFTQLATKSLGLSDKAGPFQNLDPVGAILVAPPGLGQQPVKTDSLWGGARQPGKFADIHAAASKGGV